MMRINQNQHELRSRLKGMWAKFSEKDIDEIIEDFEVLSGKLEQQYGLPKKEARELAEDLRRELFEKEELRDCGCH